MKKYQVIGASILIHSGLLQLSERQANDRRHLLNDTPVKDLYELMQPTCFKCGEVFGYEGELNKSQALELVAAETGEPASPAKASPKPSKPAKPAKEKSSGKPAAAGKKPASAAKQTNPATPQDDENESQDDGDGGNDEPNAPAGDAIHDASHLSS